MLRPLSPPQGGWESLWNRLATEGLLTLPECNNEPLGADLSYYVVEVVAGEKYRSYVYAAPDQNKCSNAKKILKLFRIINSEE